MSSFSLHGRNLLGGVPLDTAGHPFHATSPLTGETLEPAFLEASHAEVDRALALAEDAFGIYRKTPAEARAVFLETIAEEILAIGDALLQRAHQESGLPLDRLTGERGRTVGQLRLFAGVVREGSWVDARIDPALPARQPLPRPDLRRMLVPLGPVAVFGASNFPLAFSVAGGAMRPAGGGVFHAARLRRRSGAGAGAPSAFAGGGIHGIAWRGPRAL